MPWGRRRRIGSNDLQEEKPRLLLMLGIGGVHWGFLLIEGSPGPTISRMEGTRWGLDTWSFNPLQAPQKRLPCERDQEHEGRKRSTDQVVQRQGTAAGRRAPAWAMGRRNLGRRDCDCTSHHGHLESWSKSLQDVCATPPLRRLPANPLPRPLIPLPLSSEWMHGQSYEHKPVPPNMGFQLQC